MESIDCVLAEATKNATNVKALVKYSASEDKTGPVIKNYIDCLEESEKNLNYLVDLCGFYVSGQPHKVVEFYHPVGNE